MAKKLSRGVAVVGVGMSKFGVFPEKTSRDLFVEAFQELRQSVQKGFNPKDIEAFYMGNFTSDHFENQAHLAPIVASWVGIAPRRSRNRFGRGGHGAGRWARKNDRSAGRKSNRRIGSGS